MESFLAFWTLIYLWLVETLYHVLVGLCWFHQGPSFVFWTLASLFLSLLLLSRRPLCTNGKKAVSIFSRESKCMSHPEFFELTFDGRQAACQAGLQRAASPLPGAWGCAISANLRTLLANGFTGRKCTRIN